MLVIWLASITTISGCSSTSFQALPGIKTLNTKWVVVKNVQQVCQTITDGPPDILYSGCATWDRERLHCTIFTGEKVTNELLGHELRHCFYGNFHHKVDSQKY
jgi:hypothetical protein